MKLLRIRAWFFVRNIEELIILVEGNGNRYVWMIQPFGGFLINFKKFEGPKFVLVDLCNWLIIGSLFLSINNLALVNRYFLLIQNLNDRLLLSVLVSVVNCPYHQVVSVPHSPCPADEDCCI